MASKPLPIQVGTIIRNEQDRLPAWLEHWKPLAERILVLDQHSNDDTLDILKTSGVEYQQVYPVGSPDVHWDTLLSMSYREVPFFRVGVDEFIDRDVMEKMLAVIRNHPRIVMWWVSRRNWIDGHDIAEHPEVKQTMLYRDWQAIISIGGRSYSIPGRMHMWPKPNVPAEMIGFMDPDLKVEHRRTLPDVIHANESRQHICRENAGKEQGWFLRVCREVCGAERASWTRSEYPVEGWTASHG